MAHVDTQKMQEEKRVQWDIENLVFEGGGVLGTVYAGVIRELDEMNILQNCKRFAGSSAGSMTAACLAINMTPKKIIRILETADLHGIFIKGTEWYDRIPVINCIPRMTRLFKNFGVHSAQGAHEWFGDVLLEETGKRDITFKEVYDTYGKELCVVVGNVSLGRPTWCHAKTTPHLPVRTALRMSMGIPFYFEGYRGTTVPHSKKTCLYVDGGVYCNYPVHVFDGWFLSMKEEDTFERRLPTLTSPTELTSQRVFQPLSTKTLGFKLLNDNERLDIGAAWGSHFLNAIPRNSQSKLAAKWRAVHAEGRVRDWRYCAELLLAMMQWSSTTGESKMDRSALWELADTLGENEGAFEQMWSRVNVNGLVTWQDCQKYFEQGGFIWEAAVGGQRELMPHVNVHEYAASLVLSLRYASERQWYKEGDKERTVTIDVKYVKSNDFGVQAVDIRYMIEAGAHAVRSWAASRV